MSAYDELIKNNRQPQPSTTYTIKDHVESELSRRDNFSIHILNGILSNSEHHRSKMPGKICKDAIILTDMLIKELDK